MAQLSADDSDKHASLQAVREQLRAADERLELACLSAGVGTWDWNIGEDDILMDDQLYELFGLKKGEFDGKLTSFFALLHPDDVESVSAAINASVEDRAEYDTDYRIIWPNKEVHYIKAKGRVYRDENGSPAQDDRSLLGGHGAGSSRPITSPFGLGGARFRRCNY